MLLVRIIAVGAFFFFFFSICLCCNVNVPQIKNRGLKTTKVKLNLVLEAEELFRL